MSARIKIDLKPREVKLWESMMHGLEVEHEIGEDKETDFYPEGISDTDNGE